MQLDEEDYTILIHGTGKVKPKEAVGHNHDADYMLDKFVKELKANGHVVEVATITHGGRETVKAN